jgi:E3 ubiquitin-protein ligase synoviolin
MHQFEQYFHLPEPVVAPANAAGPSNAPPASTPGNVSSESYSRTGLGIWGAPVVPGRFTAVPELPPRVMSSSGGVTTRRAKVGQSSAGKPVTAAEDVSIKKPTLVTTSNLSPPQTVEAPTASPMLSGSSTPFTSNPPNVFSPTSETRPPVTSEETPAQRAAAAAQRRLGLTTLSPAVGSPAAAPPSESPTAAAVVPDNAKDKAEYFQPYLVPLYPPHAINKPLSAPHPQSATSFQSSHLATRSSSLVPPPPTIPVLPATLSTEDLERLASETREGLEERIQLLQRLDGMLYDVLGDLTRVRSLWGGDAREGTEDAPLEDSATPKLTSRDSSPNLAAPAPLEPPIEVPSGDTPPASQGDEVQETH